MFFLFILLILLILGVAIYTSRVGVEIQNLIIDTENSKGEKVNKDSKIYIYLLIFNKFKLYNSSINSNNIHMERYSIRSCFSFLF